MADEPVNPFRPGNGLEPPYLAGRQGELQSFRHLLRDFRSFPRNVALYGLRGVGKTCLLREYRYVALEAGWVVVRRELSPRAGTEVPFALALLTDLQTALEDLSAVEAVRGRAARALDAARDVLGELRFRYQEVELSLGRGSGRAGMVEDDLRRAIERVGQVADARDRGVLLLYDEFQELRDDRKAGQFPLGALVGGLAAAQQESLPVMLAASGLPPLVEHLSAAQSYTERMFEGQRIGALSEGEAARALTQPTRNGPVRFAPEVVREVVQRAGRYPYFIQHYGRELWDAAEKGAVDLDALSRAGEDARRKLDDYFFRSRLVRATPAERALMIQIAEFGEGATTQQLIERTGRRNNSLAMVVRGLIDKGLVFRPARGEVAFSAPLFGDYLRRRAHEV